MDDPLDRNIGTRSLIWDNKETEVGAIFSNCIIEETRTLNE